MGLCRHGSQGGMHREVIYVAWQPPKQDWKAGDVPSSSDFNRIEGNTFELSVADLHLAFVQKHFANIDISYGFTGSGSTRRITSVSISGDVAANITYTYDNSYKVIKEAITITAPISRSLETTYIYSGDEVFSEQRRIV